MIILNFFLLLNIGASDKKMNKFKEFKLIFDIIFFDCWYKVTTNFLAGDLFNIEGDIIILDAEYINFSNRNFQNCHAYIFIDFKKIFLLGGIRELCHGLCIIEEEEQNNNLDDK